MLEDESLEFENNLESGQTILKGLGELHIEVVLSRIREEQNLKVTVGPISVSYKETPNGSVDVLHTVDRSLNSRLKFLELEIEISRFDLDEDHNYGESNEDGQILILFSRFVIWIHRFLNILLLYEIYLYRSKQN